MIFIVFFCGLGCDFAYRLQNRAQIYDFFLINEESTPFYHLFMQLFHTFVG